MGAPGAVPRDENLLAELEAYRCSHPKSALASAACGQRWRGAAEAWSRWRGEATAENKITNEDGGEATGAFATQSSGSSKLVGRRVVSCQGGAASPLPLGAPSPRAASPSCSARRRTEVRRLLPAYRSHYGNSTMFSCSQSVTLV